MISNVKIRQVESITELIDILFDFNNVFKPPLSKRIANLEEYANKLFRNAYVYVVVENDILGFIAFYANNKETNISYLTQIAVQPNYNNKGIGKLLLDKCIEVSKIYGMSLLKLEVNKLNISAINFYEKNGFNFFENASDNSIYMMKNI